MKCQKHQFMNFISLLTVSFMALQSPCICNLASHSWLICWENVDISTPESKLKGCSWVDIGHLIDRPRTPHFLQPVIFKKDTWVTITITYVRKQGSYRPFCLIIMSEFFRTTNAQAHSLFSNVTSRRTKLMVWNGFWQQCPSSVKW